MSHFYYIVSASIDKEFHLGFHDLYPPTRVCLDPRCMSKGPSGEMIRRELSDIASHKVALFTRDLGALVSWSFSGRCTSMYHRLHNSSVLTC